MKVAKTPRLWLSIVELVLGVAMLATAALYVSLGGGYVQCQNPATFTFQSCTTVAEVGVVGLIGFCLTLFGGLGTIIGGLVRAGHLTPRQPESHPQAASLEETNLLLAKVNQLLSDARLRRASSVETIAWSEDLPWHTCRFRRKGIRKPSQLILPASLRASLTQEEWKNLLSYYFARLKPRFSMVTRFSAELFGPLLILLLILAGIKSYWSGSLLLIGNAIIDILFLAWFIRIFPWVKKTSLKQDTWVANSLGCQNLLRLFEKIDGLKLAEVENAKRRSGWIARLWPIPTITDRIVNLQRNIGTTAK